MRDFDFLGIPETGNRRSSALSNQGFRRPTDDSPFDNPPGWHGGGVEQTGGFVMNRIWRTFPGTDSMHGSRPAREVEYEVRYGQDPWVSVHRLEWSPPGTQYGNSGGNYEYAGEVETVAVEENTDRAKARTALKLMRKHQDLVR